MSKIIGFKKIGQKYTYSKISALQQLLVAKRATNVLLLVEHSPVFTVGRRMKDSEQESQLKALGADYQHSLRGGQITFHGPGQLVGYPILNLQEYKLGVRAYICALQNTIMNTCKQFGIETNTTEHTGIWIEDRKIAALGIQVQRHITSHGFALNCNTNLDWFNHIIACGLNNKSTTSITNELHKTKGISLNETIGVEQVSKVFLNCFGDTFEAKLEKLESLSPELDLEVNQFLNKN